MKYKLSHNLVNTFWLFAIQFLLLLLLYTLLRIGFYIYNNSLVPHVEAGVVLLMIWGGAKFDVVALLYLNILYILMQEIPLSFKYARSSQQIAKRVFIITNSFGVT